MTPYDRQNSPRMIMLGLANYIACIGAIPIDWLETHHQYNPAGDEFLLRIDCLGITYSGRLYRSPHQADEAAKLLPEIDRFIMLLWGEPE